MSYKMKNALIFLPETGIYPYLRTLSVAGSALKSKGYNVYIFHCNGSLYRCPMMPCCNMPVTVSEQEKEEKCRLCTKKLFEIMKEYSFNIIDGTQYNVSIDELSSKLDNTSSNKWDTMAVDNIKFGGIGKADLALEIKVFNIDNLSNEQTDLYKKYILTSYKVYQIVCKIIQDYQLNIVLTFNPYSQNIAAYLACKNNGVIFKNLTNTHLCGPSAKLIQICDGHPYSGYSAHSLHFKDGANYPINAEAVQQSFSDSLFSMYGSSSHIFSSPKNKNIERMCQDLGISTQKVVGVFTSSLDELVALLSASEIMDFKVNFEQAFADQIEWLLALKNYFSKRNDVIVLIKVHPREFRDIESQNAKRLKEIFYNKDTFNFKFIWLDNDISTYDLMEIIDCCLISHTTVGFECAKLGIPTLSFVKGLTYPDSLVIDSASNKDEYFQKLEVLLTKKSTLKDLTYCCRYFNWIKLIYSFNLGNHLPDNFFDTQIGVRTENESFLADVLENKTSYVRQNIKNLRDASYSKIEETDAIKHGIRRIIDKVYFPDQVPNEDWTWRLKRLLVRVFSGKKLRFVSKGVFEDYELHYDENVDELKNYITLSKDDSNLRFIVKNGNFAILVMHGRTYKRFSKMVLNLARIHEELLSSDCKPHK